jgi:hypothetical protein
LLPVGFNDEYQWVWARWADPISRPWRGRDR